MGYDLVTRAEIVRLLYIKDDRIIARHLNVAVSRVKHIRARHGRSKGRPRIDETTIAAKESHVSMKAISVADAAMKAATRDSSMLLLRKMLMTGQHELRTAETFGIACGIAGLVAVPSKSAA